MDEIPGIKKIILPLQLRSGVHICHYRDSARYPHILGTVAHPETDSGPEREKKKTI
ncbi:MAG: hypothetical protein WCZ46_05785 [Proteiniphilum sp.]